MNEALNSLIVSTKLAQIALLARQKPDVPLLTLAHHIDVVWLEEAFCRTRKNGAPGVDGQTAQQYEQQLQTHLQSLLERAKTGTYQAPPVRRVHIPKGDGSQTRPIGIPTLEDKVLQRAVTMVLEAVYEQEFFDFSYGFRPGRSAHQAVESFRTHLWRMKGGWILEVDIKKFFDTLDKKHIREMLNQRVRDGVIMRLVGKWLHAGVQEGTVLSYPEEGTPQGGVISPLLANIYLHEVLDKWFVQQVYPRLSGIAHLVRYADDFVFVFEKKEDAERVFEVLPKRFGKFGLTLHPDKTKLVPFGRPDRQDWNGPEAGTFDLLGFTHYWGKSKKGKWVVKQSTAKDRVSRTLRRLAKWCREHRHDQVEEQCRALGKKLRGHYEYFGITSNIRQLNQVYTEAKVTWKKWLSRRSQRAPLIWEKMDRLLQKYPLPTPYIAHQYST